MTSQHDQIDHFPILPSILTHWSLLVALSIEQVMRLVRKSFLHSRKSFRTFFYTPDGASWSLIVMIFKWKKVFRLSYLVITRLIAVSCDNINKLMKRIYDFVYIRIYKVLVLIINLQVPYSNLLRMLLSSLCSMFAFMNNVNFRHLINVFFCLQRKLGIFKNL